MEKLADADNVLFDYIQKRVSALHEQKSELDKKSRLCAVSLPSERDVRRSRADLIYDKADNVICFFVSIVSVLCQPVAKIAIADVVFYDFCVILYFFCVISVSQLFNTRNVESWLRRRNDRGSITQ